MEVLIPLDVIHNKICCHLELLDLARAMQVSHAWLHIFLADGAMAHIKRRICSAIPMLEEKYFTSYENRMIGVMKHSKATKRPKVWTFPHKGTWVSLKKNIRPLTRRNGLVKRGDNDVILAVLHAWPELRCLRSNVYRKNFFEFVGDEYQVVFSELYSGHNLISLHMIGYPPDAGSIVDHRMNVSPFDGGFGYENYLFRLLFPGRKTRHGDPVLVKRN